MRLVVKIGGALLEDPALCRRWAECITGLTAAGHQVAAIHGGGSALTRTLERLGKTSQFVDGLRVTDADTRDAALMVLAGLVNKRLVAALAALRQPALGLCGGDGMSFFARKHQNGGADLGFVGDISSVNPVWIEAAWSQAAVPVIASLALGVDGEYYNVNADQMAAACAVATHAELLAFLTDVDGVWDSDRSIIARLRASQIADLTAGGVIRGGMLPKLDACQKALAGGVPAVHILPGARMEALHNIGREPILVGTELVS